MTDSQILLQSTLQTQMGSKTESSHLSDGLSDSDHIGGDCYGPMVDEDDELMENESSCSIEMPLFEDKDCMEEDTCKMEKSLSAGSTGSTINPNEHSMKLESTLAEESENIYSNELTDTNHKSTNGRVDSTAVKTTKTPNLAGAKACAKKSFVWKYFHHPEIKLGVPDRSRTQCILCDSQLAFNASGTTTTMLNHLKSRHGEVAEQEESLRRFNRDARKTQLRNISFTNLSHGGTASTNSDLMSNTELSHQSRNGITPPRFPRGSLSIGQRGRPPGSNRRQKYGKMTTDSMDYLNQSMNNTNTNTSTNGGLNANTNSQKTMDGNSMYPLGTYATILSEQQKALLNEMFFKIDQSNFDKSTNGLIGQTNGSNVGDLSTIFPTNSVDNEMTKSNLPLFTRNCLLQSQFANLSFNLPLTSSQTNCNLPHDLSPSSSSGLGVSVTSPLETPPTSNSNMITPTGGMGAATLTGSPHNPTGNSPLGQNQWNIQTSLSQTHNSNSKPFNGSINTASVNNNSQPENLSVTQSHLDLSKDSQMLSHTATDNRNLISKTDKQLNGDERGSPSGLLNCSISNPTNTLTTVATTTSTTNLGLNLPYPSDIVPNLSSFPSFLPSALQMNGLGNSTPLDPLKKQSQQQQQQRDHHHHQQQHHYQQQQQQQQMLMTNAWLASIANGKVLNCPPSLVDPCSMLNLFNLNANALGAGSIQNVGSSPLSNNSNDSENSSNTNTNTTHMIGNNNTNDNKDKSFINPHLNLNGPNGGMGCMAYMPNPLLKSVPNTAGLMNWFNFPLPVSTNTATTNASTTANTMSSIAGTLVNGINSGSTLANGTENGISDHSTHAIYAKSIEPFKSIYPVHSNTETLYSTNDSTASDLSLGKRDSSPISLTNSNYLNILNKSSTKDLSNTSLDMKSFHYQDVADNMMTLDLSRSGCENKSEPAKKLVNDSGSQCNKSARSQCDASSMTNTSTASTKRKRARPIYICPENETKRRSADQEIKPYQLVHQPFDSPTKDDALPNYPNSSESNDREENYDNPNFISSTTKEQTSRLTSLECLESDTDLRKSDDHLSRSDLLYQLAQYLVKDLQPPEIVEGEGFQALMSLFIKHQLPTAREMRETVLANLYQTAQIRLENLLLQSKKAVMGDECGSDKVVHSGTIATTTNTTMTATTSTTNISTSGSNSWDSDYSMGLSVELWSDRLTSRGMKLCNLDESRIFANIGLHYSGHRVKTSQSYLYQCLENPKENGLLQSLVRLRELLLAHRMHKHLDDTDRDQSFVETSLPTHSWPYPLMTNQPKLLSEMVRSSIEDGEEDEEELNKDSLNPNFLIMPCLVSELSRAVTSGLHSAEINDLLGDCSAKLKQFHSMNQNELNFKRHSSILPCSKSPNNSDPELVYQTNQPDSKTSTKPSLNWKTAFNLLKWIHNNANLCDLKASERQIIKELLCVFETINQTLDLIHRKNLVLTGSMIEPILNNLSKIRLAPGTSASVVENFKSIIVSHLNESFPEDGPISDTLWIASLLDPRFKAQVQERKPSIIQLLKSKVDELSTLNSKKSPSPNHSSTDDKTNQQVGNSMETNAINEKPGLETVFGFNYFSRTSLSEVDRYLREDPIGLEEDPLNWWTRKAVNYPCVSQLAFYYLAIPLTCFAADRLRPVTINEQSNDSNNVLNSIQETDTAAAAATITGYGDNVAVDDMGLPNVTDTFGLGRLRLKPKDQSVYNFLWHNWHLTK